MGSFRTMTVFFSATCYFRGNGVTALSSFSLFTYAPNFVCLTVRQLLGHSSNIMDQFKIQTTRHLPLPC